jgi:hypothetical protein
MDTWFNEPITSGVTMYLILFGLVVFGLIAFHFGYKTFGSIFVASMIVLLAALVLGWFP